MYTEFCLEYMCVFNELTNKRRPDALVSFN